MAKHDIDYDHKRAAFGWWNQKGLTSWAAIARKLQVNADALRYQCIEFYGADAFKQKRT